MESFVLGPSSHTAHIPKNGVEGSRAFTVASSMHVLAIEALDTHSFADGNCREKKMEEGGKEGGARVWFVTSVLKSNMYRDKQG